MFSYDYGSAISINFGVTTKFYHVGEFADKEFLN